MKLNLLRAGFLIALLAIPVFAQNPASGQAARILGTIDSFIGQNLLVKSQDGQTVSITIPPDLKVMANAKASLADIKPGDFVGSAADKGPDGKLHAEEVHIFPESMRGTGEGHYDWDLKPNTKMTNANVEQTVGGVEGQTLLVKYKDGEKKLLVTPETAVVTYVVGDKSDLKPGIKIFVGAGKKQADGTVQTPRITYGKDGLTPPM